MRYAVERRDVMLRMERKVSWAVKRDPRYGNMQTRGSGKKIFAYSALRVVFSRMRDWIRDSCSVLRGGFVSLCIGIFCRFWELGGGVG